jgi:vWA-MoxR associated protein C-terminal domain/Effector-associated domain 2
MRDRPDRTRVLLGLLWPAADTVKRLADAMYEVQVMRDPRSRQQVLEHIKKRNPAFDPPRSNRDTDEIINFIVACGADDESFDLLLEAIEIYTPEDDPSLNTLREMAATVLLRTALTKDQLRELLALDPDNIARASQLAAGIRRARPGPSARQGRGVNPGNVREAALFLLDTSPPEEGLCRLLRFVDWLAQMALIMCDPPDSPMAGQLRDWIGRVAGVHDISATALRTPPRAVPDDEPALLVELEPALGNSFTVHVWLWVPGAGARTLDWDENPCRLEDLRARIDELLEAANRGLVHAEGRLRVEFFLDFETFNHDVDWWLFGADEGLARPLGAQYTVIVRRQRCTAQEQRDWRDRWQALKQAPGPVSDLVTWVTDATTVSLKDLWSQLRNDRAMVLVEPVGTCEKLDSEMKKLLYLALKQGVPVALCVRRTPADATRHLDSLKASLVDARLDKLPELVRKWRHQAFMEGGDHFGQHLVLLWDDYDRRLPGAQGKLSLPAVKGAGQ